MLTEQILAPLLIFVLPILLVAGVAAYGASVTCRLAILRHRRVTWRSGGFAVGVAGFLAAAFMCLGLVLPPGKLPYAEEFAKWILIISCGGSLVGILPALRVVSYYRRPQQRPIVNAHL